MSFACYLHRDDTILRGRMIECFQTIKWFNNLCLKISYTLKACFNSENVIEVCTFFVTPKTKAKHKINALKKRGKEENAVQFIHLYLCTSLIVNLHEK
jgi:hypothetical protein